MLASKTYEGRPSEAEHRYLDIATSLGWAEHATVATDETEEQVKGGGGGTGMGVSVSVVAPPSLDEEAATSSGLHGHAMGGDIAATSAFLRDNEGLDINALDEYVSFAGWRCARFGVFFFSFLTMPGMPATFRDTLRCTWPQIEGTSLRLSFYSNMALIKHSE